MSQVDSPLISAEAHPTQHAMLIIWGYFARTIGLLEQVAQVPIGQKAVRRPPQEKLLEWLIGLLSGIEYLSDLSEGAAPLVQDATQSNTTQESETPSVLSVNIWLCGRRSNV